MVEVKPLDTCSSARHAGCSKNLAGPEIRIACRRVRPHAPCYGARVTVGPDPGTRPFGPVRLSSFLILTVSVLALIGTAYLTSGENRTEIYVAAVDLPAYHQLTQADVRKKSVSARDLPESATTERDALLGRYTLSYTRQEEPLRLNHLGPRLDPQAISGSILALPANSETTLGAQLGRGDIVDVLLSPKSETAIGQPATSRRIDGILVLDTTPPPNKALIVAVDPTMTDDLLVARGYSMVSIIRVRAYAGP